MDDLAAAAEIAKGTIYLYFPSRADLLAALRHRYAENLAGRAEVMVRADRAWTRESLIAAVQRMVRELVDYLRANQDLHHVLFQQAGVSEEETMAPLRDLLRSTLEQAMADGALEPIDPDILMRFLLDGLHGAVLPLLHGAKPKRKRTLEPLNELVRRVLV